MLKRFFVFFTLLALSTIFAAKADIIIEPRDGFYSRNRQDCGTVSLNYAANGENGFVSAKKEPGSDTETAKIENGETLHICAVYSHQGKNWGLYEFREPYGWESGWVPMDQLSLIYDNFAFTEEHKGEFYEYADIYQKLKNSEKIVLWTYPGSGEIVKIVDVELSEDQLFKYYTAYKDAEGREWTFMKYFPGEYEYGTWICISDPENDNIAVKASNGLSLPWLVIILVAALLFGTAVLIRLLWKPNKK
ncbi:MAG: hypothetical protein FWG34_09715 [Oscillospiraceae bacterium]|nr:hypothetical protein [Oscillospiraceae bacterium]